MGAEPGEVSGVNAFIFPDATNWRTLSSSSPETLDVEVDCHVGRSRYAEKSQAVGKCKCKWGQMQMQMGSNANANGVKCKCKWGQMQMQMGSGLAFKHNRGLFCERSAASCSNCMIARPAPGFMLGKCVNARPDPVCTNIASSGTASAFIRNPVLNGATLRRWKGPT